tara:strand:- start:606 stop:899 length:294 start_codon:yes stop_codon:yes gene_type:complete
MSLFTSSHELPNYAIVQNILAKNASIYLESSTPSFLRKHHLEQLSQKMHLEISHHASVEEAYQILGDLLELFVTYGKDDPTNDVLKTLTYNVYNLYN